MTRTPPPAAFRPAERQAVSRTLAQHHAIWLGLACLILFTAWMLRIDSTGRVLLPFGNLPLPDTCWFHRVTGSDCLGCGMTRSFIALARGGWWEAWTFHPLGWFLFVLVLFQVPYRVACLIQLARGGSTYTSPWISNWAGLAFLAAWIAFFVLRQIYRL